MTTISQEVKDQARSLIEAGAKRLDLELSLGLKQTTAHELYVRVLLEKAVEDNPSLLETAKELVMLGETRFTIANKLSISMTATDMLMTLARTALHDEEIRMDDDACNARMEERSNNEKSRSQLAELLKKMVDDGASHEEMLQKTGIGLSRLNIALAELRADDFLHSRLMGKAEKASYVDRLLTSGRSSFDVARVLDVSPGTAQKLIKKVSGNCDLTGDTFKQAMARGASLFQLINRFGVKDAAEVTGLFNEYFPNHLLHSKDLEGGDVSFTVIPDSSGHFNWLNANSNRKRFRYSVSPENNYLYVQFDPDVTCAKIYNLTDIHVGHKHFDRQRFLSYVKMILEDDNAFAVLGGDIFEWAHKLSVGDPWEQILSPMEQVSESARLLMPIAHKLLAYRPGNHDKGRGKHNGSDLAEVLAHYLKVPYFKMENIMDFRIGSQLFTVSLDHGHSGGALQSILRDAEKYKEFTPFFVHAHFSGHVHNSQIIERIMRDRTIGIGFEMKRSYTIIGGSCLDYTSSYAEEAKYTPSPQDLTYFEMEQGGDYVAGKIRSNGR